MTSCDLLVETAQRGLTVTVRDDRLAVKPNRLLTPDFAEILRRHKPELLALLRLRFLIVRSVVLNETVFFAADEATKAALVDAGAERAGIYTREETPCVA